MGFPRNELHVSAWAAARSKATCVAKFSESDGLPLFGLFATGSKAEVSVTAYQGLVGMAIRDAAGEATVLLPKPPSKK